MRSQYVARLSSRRMWRRRTRSLRYGGGATLKSRIASFRPRSFELGEFPPEAQVKDLHSTRIDGSGLPRSNRCRFLNVADLHGELGLQRQASGGEKDLDGGLEVASSMGVAERAQTLVAQIAHAIGPVRIWPSRRPARLAPQPACPLPLRARPGRLA